MEEVGNDPVYFCYFNINNRTEMIIGSVLIFLSVLLIGDAFRKYFKLRGSHNSNVNFIYRMIFAWWITYVTSNVFQLIVFSIKDSDPLSYNDQQMSTITKYYFVIDWVNAFSIQWLLLYVPYHWAKRITDLFCGGQKGSQVEFSQRQIYKGYEVKIYPMLKIYMRVRLLFLIMPIVFLILDDQLIIFKFLVSLLLIDCIAITISLIFGMISLKTTKQLQIQLDEQESKQMFNQYLMMVVANTIRFGFDLTYVISKVFGDDSYSKICPDFPDGDITFEVIMNIGTCLLTHYLPIFIILRIYNLQDKPEQICKSLLVSGDNESGMTFSD